MAERSGQVLLASLRGHGERTGLVNIGDWVRRPGRKWHLIESVIARDAITKCGRRMDAYNSDGKLEYFPTEPLTRMIGQPQNCKRCS